MFLVELGGRGVIRKKIVSAWGGGGEGACGKKLHARGGAYSFVVAINQIPPSPPPPMLIKNERSLDRVIQEFLLNSREKVVIKRSEIKTEFSDYYRSN